MPALTPSWDDICAVLDTVLEMPPDAREAFLAGGSLDEPLRREVEAYLAYEFVREPVLDPPSGSDGEANRHASLVARVLQDGLDTPGEESAATWPTPGTVLGAYRLDRLVATGGAGAVFEATDLEASRRVAVKILPPLRADVLGRLRREVRALARLDHPHVARFFTAARVPESGLAYFAMEFVEGEPVTAFADVHGLSIGARARLVEQVCEAVQHAHERLVVHRDLKPSNVLVADTHKGPSVKVVDFGIGKRLDTLPEGDAADGAEDRRDVPYLRLTPAYAAPEQLRGEPATTASDVYSIGVLAYELFVGVRPPMPDVAPGEASALAPRPSDAAPPERAVALRGDLDAIVQKALALRPEDRYRTVAALGADLAAARQHGVVSARRVPRTERAARFVRRHRQGVALSAMAFAVVVGLSAVYLWTVTLARQRADREASTSNEVVAMLTSLFDAADPYSETADTARVRTVVARAADAFLASPPADPLVRARLACTLARVRTSLMDLDGAGQMFGPCLAGIDPAWTDTAEAAPPRADLPRWAVAALRDRAVYARERGAYADARRYALASVAAARRSTGPQSMETAQSLSRLGDVYAVTTQPDSAEAVYREALALTRAATGETSLLSAAATSDLGMLLGQSGKYPEAIALQQRALAIQQQRLGPRHVAVAKSLNNLGATFSESGQYARADSALRAAHRTYVATLGQDHAATALPLENLGVIYARNGQFDRAAALLDSVYRFRSRVLGPDHPDALFALSSLARIESERGHNALAVRLLSDGAARAERTLGPAHQTTLMLEGNLAFTYIALKDGRRAEAIFRRTNPTLVRSLGADHPMAGMATTGLAEALLLQHRGAEAEPLVRTALATLRTTLPPEHPQVLNAQSRLGKALLQQRRFDEAERVLLARYDTARQHYPAEHDQPCAAAGTLALLYTTWQRPADAARYNALAGRFAVK